MKKYLFEAAKKQLEKPAEPKYVFCAAAKTTVCAENKETALTLAQEKLRREYSGSGIQLGQVKLVAEYDLPTDWSYGYGDARRSGPTEEIGDLVGGNVIR